MKTVVYVEESENALAKAVVMRKDINLILIRFSNCTLFSKEHIEVTKNIPTFIIDKSADFEQECSRLKNFLNERCENVDVFYNDSEFNQVYIQKVARVLNFPDTLTEYQALVVRDKYVMKQFIESIGLKCAEYCLVESSDDVERCAEKWKFPFIIKWRIGVSSIEVYKINCQSDIERLKLDYGARKYMAEQFQTDKIWCIDAIVKNGEIFSNLYTWLPFTNLSFAESKTQFTQLSVGYPQKYWKFAPKQVTHSIVKGLKLGSGYLHLEVFVSDEGDPVICEFAWRTPGDHILQNFTILYERSVEDLLIDVLLGKDIQKLETTHICVADVFLPMVDGRIKKITSIEELTKECDIIDGEVLYSEGDVLSSQHRYTDASGWVQLKASGIEEMLEKIENVYSVFTLVVEEIEDDE